MITNEELAKLIKQMGVDLLEQRAALARLDASLAALKFLLAVRTGVKTPESLEAFLADFEKIVDRHLASDSQQNTTQAMIQLLKSSVIGGKRFDS